MFETFGKQNPKKKNNRIGTYEINKSSFLYCDDKICILNNGYDGLAFGYLSYIRNISYLNNYLGQLFCQAKKMLFDNAYSPENYVFKNKYWINNIKIQKCKDLFLTTLKIKRYVNMQLKNYCL